MVEDAIIRVTGLRTGFGQQIIHDNLDFEVRRGEVMAVVGGSGQGKSVLMRTIIGLNRQFAGTIEVFGQDTSRLDDDARRRLGRRWGVLFQDGALFSSLTVAQNVELPLKEHTELAPSLIEEIASIKISMVGLAPDACTKYPSELSGGMRKRAGLARAMALDPEILFLDEPTSGLDPIGAAAFDSLIRNLQQSLNLTVLLNTHDLDSLYAVSDRVAVLIDRRLVVGTIETLLEETHPWVHEYFHGPRGRAAMAG
jgi:phospholipid/cholesterol/gamma-HCH transport system ATP-binding protein